MSSTPEPTAGDARDDAPPRDPARDLTDEAAATPEAALTAALAGAQAAFPKIARNHTAEVRGKDGKPGYSYTYADLGDVLAAVRPVLAEHGLAIVQRTVREAQAVVLLTELRHIAGGELVSEVLLGQASTNPQQFGGALTYLRRYELVTLLGIAAEEDRDAQDVDPPRNGHAAPELPVWALEAAPARKRELVDLVAGDLDVDRDRAKVLLGAVKDSLGYVPDVLVAFMRALETVRNAPADAERAAQDDAAAAPDVPAPEEVDAEPEEEPPPGVGASLDEDEDAPAGVGTEDAPAPGTVTVDARGDDEAPVKYVTRLRAAGCICAQPVLGLDEPQRIDDRCPIREHGIPF